ncbi:hypothetical protein GCM10025884_21210 [Leuconostoc gelidum subsp. gelidum]|nr:hypothetical protein GCM10025884_21210 [Leuconostoc gelidum subsp. gelidum]
MTEIQNDAQRLIDFIANAKKVTPVKVTYKGVLDGEIPANVQQFGGVSFGQLIGDWSDVQPLIASLPSENVYIENESRNSAVPLLDKLNINARIEPGAIIREQVEIGDNAVIMLGAVINIGAEIGASTMIDMGAILGGVQLWAPIHILVRALFWQVLSNQPLRNQFVLAITSWLVLMLWS